MDVTHFDEDDRMTATGVSVCLFSMATACNGEGNLQYLALVLVLKMGLCCEAFSRISEVYESPHLACGCHVLLDVGDMAPDVGEILLIETFRRSRQPPVRGWWPGHPSLAALEL